MSGLQVALLFGSFNPVHIGHLVLANYVLAYTSVDEVWLVVSPHNPLKQRSELADQQHRLRMVQLAVDQLPLPIKASDIEFDLPQPSYTIDTLNKLTAICPKHIWRPVMGADNLAHIEQWKDYRKLLNHYKLLVYPRPGFDISALCCQFGADELNAPQMEISSTFIRQSLAEGANMDAFMPSGVGLYIREAGLY